MDFMQLFNQGLEYGPFLDQYGTDEHRERWAGVHAEVSLTDDQRTVLQSFRREMNVLCLAGTWCGDCVNQCPIWDHFTAANELVRVRYLDRDDNLELAEELSINGGNRVPALVFLSEDGFVCGRHGDRTLAKYRQMGGASGDTPLLTAVTQEWLDEFERIQLMLQTSGRLRELHGH